MFKLSQRSKDRLKGVHPDLVKVVEHAIEITTVDFTVLVCAVWTAPSALTPLFFGETVMVTL